MPHAPCPMPHASCLMPLCIKTNVRAILRDMDEINPKFTYLSPIHFDELDPMKMLHNSRFAAHVERAITAWYESIGGRWELRAEDNPDQFHVVRDLHIEYLAPFVGTGTMRIDLWVDRIGTTSCVYAFLCSSTDGMWITRSSRPTYLANAPEWHNTVWPVS